MNNRTISAKTTKNLTAFMDSVEEGEGVNEQLVRSIENAYQKGG